MSFITWSNVAGETTLGAALTDTTGITVTVASSALIQGTVKSVNPGLDLYIAIDDEIMKVVAVTAATTITVTRGALGTTAATHSNSAPIHVLSLAALVKLVKAVAVAAAPGS